MASIPYLIISPSALVSFIGLMHGADKTIPTPAEDWRKASIDLLIPAHNEEQTIVLCLESITKQTLKPRNILLIDDGSTDRTGEFAQQFADSIGLEITILRRDKSIGKTPSLSLAARESDADVLFVLDGDTTLRSPNYIERAVQELFQGVGIASTCGVILPQYERDRQNLINTPDVKKFAEKYPEVAKPRNRGFLDRVQQSITNNYREELYLFLQKFIYHGEMVFFGTIINPVGCAVAYRRKYIKEVFDHYQAILGHDLTTSEDIFIGFTFADRGFRNAQLDDVYAHSREPRLSQLPRQIMLWSSAFLQSCYYFDDLVRTPFKSVRLFFKKMAQRFSPTHKKIVEKRKIKEAYRQSFGSQYTHLYGRPIGWFIFTSAFEKVSFPSILIIMIILQWWVPLFITVVAEITLYTLLIAFMHKNRKIRNMLKSICFAPIRYSVLFYDLIVLANFVKDLWLTKNRNWRK